MNLRKRLKFPAERFVIAAAAGIATVMVLAWWRGAPVEPAMLMLAVSLGGSMGMVTFLIQNRNAR